MTSCSDSDSDSTTNPGTGTDAIQLKKTIDDYGDDGLTTAIYTYDGDKIVTVTETNGTDGAHNTSTYNSNGYLVKTVQYVGTELTDEETYEYDGTKLISYTDKQYGGSSEPYVSKSVYTQSLDGNTITSSDYAGVESNLVMTSTTVRTLTDGNLVKVVTTSTTDSDNITTDIFTFDDKNSPTKNAASDFLTTISYNYGGKNNIIKQVHTNSADATDNYTMNITYTYNNNNYPVTSTSTGSFFDVTTQYFYE